MKAQCFLFLLVFAKIYGYAQEFPRNYFQAPLDIPMYLSGNFGELRNDHYHSGIDIKTQGREGLCIYAAAQGFVSRIKVSANGYGKAIYIEHPNGYTTVYGHLKEFCSSIDSIVKTFQYDEESFEIDRLLTSEQVLVKKGELIAFSGNSGSSGGPHLHFEIRETATEFPTNPLLYGFDIKDAVPPIMRSLFIYPLDIHATIDGQQQAKCYDLVKQANNYSIRGNRIPLVNGKLGFALDARDYMDGTHNYYGIYELYLFVDQKVRHHFTFHKFSFDESRYINAHIDYELLKKYKRRIHKLFHENNHKESFANVINHGISLKDGKKHEVKIVITDAYGNKSSLQFSLRSSYDTTIDKVARKQFKYEQENELKDSCFFVKIPPKTFYKNIDKGVVTQRDCKASNSYSPLFHFLDRNIPLQNDIKVGIVPYYIPLPIKNKAFIAIEKDGQYKFIGNKWEGNYLIGMTNEVGEAVVLVDTLAPRIELWKGSSFRHTGQLRYRITDALSGVKSYQGEIDGKWVLFQYDPKRELLWYTLSEKQLEKGKQHKLLLKVTDACGNTGVREVFFTW